MESAFTYGEILVRLGDPAGASAAFERGSSDEAAFGRLLLRKHVGAARTALTKLRDSADDDGY